MIFLPQYMWAENNNRDIFSHTKHVRKARFETYRTSFKKWKQNSAGEVHQPPDILEESKKLQPL